MRPFSRARPLADGSRHRGCPRRVRTRPGGDGPGSAAESFGEHEEERDRHDERADDDHAPRLRSSRPPRRGCSPPGTPSSTRCSRRCPPCCSKVARTCTTATTHSTPCCHAGGYNPGPNDVWIGPSAFTSPARLRYVAVHELGHSLHQRTTRAGCAHRGGRGRPRRPRRAVGCVREGRRLRGLGPRAGRDGGQWHHLLVLPRPVAQPGARRAQLRRLEDALRARPRLRPSRPAPGVSSAIGSTVLDALERTGTDGVEPPGEHHGPAAMVLAGRGDRRSGGVRDPGPVRRPRREPRLPPVRRPVQPRRGQRLCRGAGLDRHEPAPPAGDRPPDGVLPAVVRPRARGPGHGSAQTRCTPTRS